MDITCCYKLKKVDKQIETNYRLKKRVNCLHYIIISYMNIKSEIINKVIGMVFVYRGRHFVRIQLNKCFDQLLIVNIYIAYFRNLNHNLSFTQNRILFL